MFCRARAFALSFSAAFIAVGLPSKVKSRDKVNKTVLDLRCQCCHSLTISIRQIGPPFACQLIAIIDRRRKEFRFACFDLPMTVLPDVAGVKVKLR